MALVSVNGVRVYYEIHGSGEPLLLAAGLGSDSQSWLPVLEELARGWCVIVLDNRGVGRTTPLDAEVTIGRMADDAMALTEQLGFSRVHLLGHSMGGFVAQDCAIRYAESVDRLVLAGTAASSSARNNALLRDWAAWLESGMDPEAWFRNVFYWLYSARFFEDREVLADALRYVVEYPYPPSAASFRRQVEAIAEFDCSAGLAGIRSPTLVVGGQEDLLFPPEQCARLTGAIPGARLALVDRAGHSIHTENPSGFLEPVLEFLRR